MINPDPNRLSTEIAEKDLDRAGAGSAPVHDGSLGSPKSFFQDYERVVDTASLFSSVLLVEDELPHAKLVARALSGLVGDITHVTTGQAALRAVEGNLFELVLCDLHLPDASGVNLLAAIHDARPDLPMIVMTSSSNLEDAVSAMREGAWDYMVKQFSEDLVERIRFVITRTAERKLQQMRELQLRAERDAFWAAVRTAQDGLAILGGSGAVVFSNDRFNEFCAAMAGEQELSYPANFLQLVERCDPQVGKALTEHLNGHAGDAMWSTEVRAPQIKPKDAEGEKKGTDRYFELTVSSVKLVGIADVTDGASAVSELRRSVVWAKEITRKKEQEKFQRDLLSTTTHDLKGPLGAILTSAELLGQMVKTDDKRVLDLIPRIASCARNSINLIDELLSARRIQDGVLVVKPHWYDLAGVFEDVVLDYLPLAKAKNIEFSHRPVVANLRVFADKLGLHRVLGNLVSNAIKFTAKGGKVEIFAEDVVQHSEKDRFEVRISVSDTGTGIDTGNRAKLFERYSRLDQHQGIEGTGLGLYVTKNIIDAHGGRIEITSQLGVGTTFTVCLPCPLDPTSVQV